MKRTLLLTAACTMLATAGFAQAPTGKVMKAPTTKHSTTQVYKKGEAQAQPQPRRSLNNGVYYTHERGAMFMGYDKEGRGYSGSFLTYPPFHTPFFKNMCGSTDIQWFINDQDITEWMEENGDLYFVDMPKTMVSEEGLSAYPAPVLTKGSISYFINEWDKHSDAANEDGSKVTVTNYPGWDMAYNFSDMNTNVLYGGGSIDPGTGGRGHNTYIYGTGAITFSDGSTYQSVGIAQVFPAPISAFVCNEIGIRTMSNTTPIAEGKTLTMELRNVVTNEDGSKTFGDEIYETLVSTSDDVSDAWTYSDGDKVYNVCFHKKEIDDFGIEANVPVILDKDFCILIYGVSNEGIDCGFMGLTMDDIDIEDVPAGEPLITDGEGIGSFSYGVPISLQADFYGYFDAVEIPTVLYSQDEEGNSIAFEDCNVLRVSADGQTVVNEKYPEDFGEYVYFSVARDWEDADGNENYFFDGPEWIDEMVPYSTSSSEETGMYLFSLKCLPLAEGETGRIGYINLVANGGLTSEKAIVVLQGDASFDEAMGIATVATNGKKLSGKRYNLSGQQVNANYKGVVIENGVKVVKK